MGSGVAIGLSLALGVLLTPAPAAAQAPGVPVSEIRIGYVGGGPGSDAVGKAIGAYFTKVNDDGGLGGRRIKYVTSPGGDRRPGPVEAVRTLVEQDRVLLLLHDAEAPVSSAVQRYAGQRRVPHLLLAPAPGRWSDPRSFPWTIGWPPNHRTEGRIYAQHLLANAPDARIGILYQDDDYGRDHRKGLLDGLGDAARRMVVLEQSYAASDPAIDAQIVSLKNSGADVFLNATIPKFARPGDQEGP